MRELDADARLLAASEQTAGRSPICADYGVALMRAGGEVTVKAGDVWQGVQD